MPDCARKSREVNTFAEHGPVEFVSFYSPFHPVFLGCEQSNNVLCRFLRK